MMNENPQGVTMSLSFALRGLAAAFVCLSSLTVCVCAQAPRAAEKTTTTTTTAPEPEKRPMALPVDSSARAP
jgi:hypothetical protein